MKKTIKLLSLFAFALLLVVLVGCSKSDSSVKSKNNPFITSGDTVLASLKDGSNTYEVTNGEAYMHLKVDNGAESLVDLIDEYLLKNKAEKDYLALVTDEELVKAIDKDCFGEDELTDEEKEEKKTDFLDKVFVSLNIRANDIYDAKIKDSYRLKLAEKLYAKDILVKKVDETDKAYEEYSKLSDEDKKKQEDPVTAPYFSDSKVSAKYNKDNVSKYSVIIVTFPTNRLATIALTAIGVKVVDGKWVNLDGSNLTNDQILAKYIELYNYNYGYKGLELTKDSEEFDYTLTELNSFNPTTAKRVQDKMVSFGEDGTWYFADPFETGSGSLFVFALKIDEEVVKAYDDLTDDEKKAARETYKDSLVEDALTTSYIGARLAELRKDNNIVIYDTVLEKDYASAVASYSVEFNTTDVEKKDVVASVDGKDFTCDELFDKLVGKYANAVVAELLAEKKVLADPKANPYYQNGTWVDSSKKADVEQLIEAEKTNFKNGSYSSYGFDATTTSWQTFMEASYSVRTEEELMMYFLLDAVKSNYTSRLNYIVNGETKDSVTTYELTEEEAKASKLWTNIQATMQKTVDEYFSVKGIHLLISSYETTTDYINGTTPLDPEKWTDEQKEKAVALALEVVNYVNEETGTYQSRLQKVVDAFKTCPNKDGAYTFNGKDVQTKLVSTNEKATVNVSLYKGYGLYVKFESLGTFENGSMVAEFNDAVKAIYDAQLALGNYGTDKSAIVVNAEAIKTVYGYHVYINLLVNEPKYAEKTENKVMDPDSGEEKGDGTYTYRYLPTLEEVRIYTKDNSSTSLSSNVKNALAAYYKNIASELTGSYFASAMQYYGIKNLTLTSTKVNSEDFVKYVSDYIDLLFESNLKLVTADYLE